jgi:hypothetical protein
LLRAVCWGKVKNTNRKNVIPSGEGSCQSFILGPNMHQSNHSAAAAVNSLRYPILERTLRALVAAADPSFKYTNITVNRNLPCKPHRDTGNIGDSLIIGFGEFTGGQLAIEDGAAPARSGTCTPKSFRCEDLMCRFVRFNGGKNMHWTLPFEGERYSAVFYTHRGAQ